MKVVVPDYTRESMHHIKPESIFAFTLPSAALMLAVSVYLTAYQDEGKFCRMKLDKWQFLPTVHIPAQSENVHDLTCYHLTSLLNCHLCSGNPTEHVTYFLLLKKSNLDVSKKFSL